MGKQEFCQTHKLDSEKECRSRDSSNAPVEKREDASTTVFFAFPADEAFFYAELKYNDSRLFG